MSKEALRRGYMSKEALLAAVARMLPPEQKGKEGEIVEVFDDYFNKMVELVESAYKDERIPVPFRAGVVRRMFVGMATGIFFKDGMGALISSATPIAQNIQAEIAEQAKKQKPMVKVVKNLEGLNEQPKS
jgi:hypothetical protein